VIAVVDDNSAFLSKTAGSRTLGATLLDDHETGLGEFEELCWQYLHKLPRSLRLGQIKTRIEDDPGAYGCRRYEFDSRLFLLNDTSEQPEPVGQLMVTLYRKPRGATNDIFLELEQCQLWYPAMRGQGLGKTIVELVANLGRELGVQALTAIAIYDGRWVWSKLGFQFGDYLPDANVSHKFNARFSKFCYKHGITPPDMTGWDAQDIANFKVEGVKLPASVGHRMDRKRQSVEVGRAFLLSRRPFFLSYPLEKLDMGEIKLANWLEADLAKNRS
jgi:GNAT superfamily N-acetyltransferase